MSTHCESIRVVFTDGIETTNLRVRVSLNDDYMAHLSCNQINKVLKKFGEVTNTTYTVIKKKDKRSIYRFKEWKLNGNCFEAFDI